MKLFLQDADTTAAAGAALAEAVKERRGAVIYLQGKQSANKQDGNHSQSAHYKLFPNGYMTQVDDEYSHFFHLYQSAPLLTVNADELDLAGNDDHFQLLLRALEDFQGTRSYLNLSEK